MKAANDRKGCKRGRYNHYDAETRAKIGKYASEHGNLSAATYFSSTLEYPVSESTVRNMKRAYLERLKTVQDPAAITSLPHGRLGRPLLLGDQFDKAVADYMMSLRAAGGVVNRSIAIAAAKGIVSHSKPSLLSEHGGPLNLGVKWAESFLRRHCLRKCQWLVKKTREK